MIDLTGLTYEELDDLIRKAAKQRDRLKVLSEAPERADQLAHDVAAAEGLVRGTPWKARGAVGYPKGWEVTHDGKTWRSTTPGNVWKPGVSGWRQVMEDGSPAPYLAPTGRHDAYMAGERVRWQEQVYEATTDYVVHSPAEHPGSWMAIVGSGDGEPGTEPPPPSPEPDTVTAWAEWVNYRLDDLVSYGGTTYRVRQSHTSQPGWEPPNAAALFEAV